MLHYSEFDELWSTEGRGFASIMYFKLFPQINYNTAKVSEVRNDQQRLSFEARNHAISRGAKIFYGFKEKWFIRT